MKVNRTRGLLGGLLAGALVGTAIGLLLAPKPGRTTREVVGARAGKLQHRAGEYVGQLRTRFQRDQEGNPVGASVNHREPDES
jgi:gas vesicle protein